MLELNVLFYERYSFINYKRCNSAVFEQANLKPVFRYLKSTPKDQWYELIARFKNIIIVIYACYWNDIKKCKKKEGAC